MQMAAIYTRVSSERQREAHTIASQTAALVEWATTLDLEVPRDWIFEDDGYSGATLERPGLERVRDLAAAGDIEVVLVHSPELTAQEREDCRAPQSDAEFVASMEQVLDLYQKPYDPDCPVVCMDEQPVQLVKETRAPMAATKNRPRRVDYEYERAGTASIFLFSEPLAGWRQATARARRTKVDWALEVAGLLEGRYADCEKITLVCDNLNTHTKGAFYKVFEPTRARQLVRRIEFCYTPKHGSWLNIAENELSSLTRQCVRGRRIGDLGTLHGEVSAWSTDVNGTQRGVDWQMKVDDARCKLKSVYPKIMA